MQLSNSIISFQLELYSCHLPKLSSRSVPGNQICFEMRGASLDLHLEHSGSYFHNDHLSSGTTDTPETQSCNMSRIQKQEQGWSCQRKCWGSMRWYHGKKSLTETWCNVTEAPTWTDGRNNNCYRESNKTKSKTVLYLWLIHLWCKRKGSE